MAEPLRGPAPAEAARSPQRGAYRWYILTLAALTHTLVVGMPMMSLPVLFDEIAAELSLNLVQVGYVWGASSLLGVAMSLTGGVIGDRIGARRMLVAACLLSGLAGATRAFAGSYATLTATVLLAGLFPMATPMNVHKTCGVWFSGPRLGMANGVVSAGMALGFLLGSLVSATLLSPLLGGWRNVLLFYAALAVIFSLLWAFTQPQPTPNGPDTAPAARPTLRDALLRVARLRNVWLLALAMFGIGGAIQGSLGYLPLYLRNRGWEPGAADGALASFHFASLLFYPPHSPSFRQVGGAPPYSTLGDSDPGSGIRPAKLGPRPACLDRGNLRRRNARRLHGDHDDPDHRAARRRTCSCRHCNRPHHGGRALGLGGRSAVWQLP